MLFAIASLFLSAILMTRANVIEDDVTNIEPLSEELFIYDVISDATAAELKMSLTSAGVEVRHSCQVLGTRQYFFVVVGDLSQLTFPEGSVVTQYPVEHVRDFYAMFGVHAWGGNDTQDSLGDTNLALAIWEMVVSQGTSTAQYKQMIRDFANIYEGAAKRVSPVHYAVVGRYHTKLFLFSNVPLNFLQKGIMYGLDTAGGPGNNVINVLRLGKV